MNRLRKIFERHSVVVRKIRATRAMFVSPDVQEVHVEFVTDENDRLVLQLAPRHAYTLIHELTNAYNAINPPLRN